METEKELNVKILAKTLEILEKHPEVSEFLDEMPITIPNENKLEININFLKNYYDSFIHILNTHY